MMGAVSKDPGGTLDARPHADARESQRCATKPRMSPPRDGTKRPPWTKVTFGAVLHLMAWRLSAIGQRTRANGATWNDWRSCEEGHCHFAIYKVHLQMAPFLLCPIGHRGENKGIDGELGI